MRTTAGILQKVIDEVRAGNRQTDVARKHGLTDVAVSKIMARARRRDAVVVPDLDSVREPREWIAALARKLDRSHRSLMVLSPNADPFNAGGKAQWKFAEWFAKLWEKEFSGKTGIHIRRVHYRAEAIAFPKMDGTAYTNCKRDWFMLNKASKYARNLGLVDPLRFVDQRNDAPGPLNWRRAELTEPQAADPFLNAFLPSVRINNLEMDWSISRTEVDGYQPDDFLDRQFYCECWIEKSTMADILEPLCRELGVRPITSIGTQSITNAIALLDRAARIKKPTRVFYVCDYDRKGSEMPVSVSRHIERWGKKLGFDLDIKLFHTCLTRAQIIKHKLPKNPLTKATELDALEGKKPGAFAEIIREAFTPYCDVLDNELKEAEREAKRIAEDEWDEVIDPYREKLARLQKKVKRVTKRYQKEVVSLNRRLGKAMKQFQGPLDSLTSEIAERIQNFSPGIPERPGPDDYEIDFDESAALFDSKRDPDVLLQYLKQLDASKAYQAAINAVLPKLNRKEKSE